MVGMDVKDKDGVVVEKSEEAEEKEGETRSMSE
jgi:hypothetical protein